MLLDLQNLFSENQAITTGTIYSTNTVKFGKNDISYVPVIIQVTNDFSDLTSLTVNIQTSSDAEFTSPVTLLSSSLLLADLKAGAKFPISYLPKGNLGYVRLSFVVEAGVGVTESTGKITAGVVASCELGYHEAAGF